MPEKTKNRNNPPAAQEDHPKRRHLSMHEDVPVWCDCCTCEAEPYWQAVEYQMERDQRQRDAAETKHDA